MEKVMNDMLLAAIKEYGDTAYISDFKIVLKNWKRNSASSEVKPVHPNDLTVRNALIGLGQILEENLEKHTYIATIRVGQMLSNEALMVTHLHESTLSIAAYAQEGLISQHIAQKAVDLVIKQIPIL